MKSLHLHVLDMDYLGPTFHALQHRNLSIDTVIAALEAEKKKKKILAASKDAPVL